MSTQTVSNAVATRDAGPVAVMWSKKKHFDAVLPASVDVEAFLGTAAGALYADPKTMAAAVTNPDSLITVLMKCAALGHLPGTEEFYLYNRKRKGRPEVAGTEGYRGIIERMYRSGAVAKVVVREVCADDPFEYVEGVDRVPRHEVGGQGTTGAAFFGAKGDRKRGEMVGVYAYAELLTGSVSRVVLLSRDDVHAARDSGDAKDSEFSPWNRLDGGAAHPEFRGRSMWWKTAARRLEPWVPTSREYRASMLTASARAAELSPPPRLTQLPPSDSAVVDAVIVDDPDVPPAEQPPPPADAAPSAAPAGGTRTHEELLEWISGRLAQLGVEDAADKLRAVSLIAGKPVKSARGLSHAEAVKVADTLDAIDGPGPDGLLADLATAGDPREQDGDGGE